MKNCIGKDLSRIPMPVKGLVAVIRFLNRRISRTWQKTFFFWSQVNFNEPLSMLQRLTEDLEYSELLDRAARCDSSLEQMCLVAAFSVSSYSTTVHRTAKPFNPLLGETYELDRLEEYGYRSISEQVRQSDTACSKVQKHKCTMMLKPADNFISQVSHHPPAAAHHVTSQHGWTLWQHITIDSKFRGKYISVMPLGKKYIFSEKFKM